MTDQPEVQEPAADPAPSKGKTAKQIAAANAVPVKMVKCRVTKAGAGQISTGEHVASEGDIMHDKGDEIEVEEGAAEALETRHFVEIL